jgi:hypothetical protein
LASKERGAATPYKKVYPLFVEIFLFLFVLSIVAGYFASTKSRSGFGWFFLSFLISPVITLIILAILPSKGSPNLSFDGKLKELERIRASGFITEEEYKTKRKAILDSL